MLVYRLFPHQDVRTGTSSVHLACPAAPEGSTVPAWNGWVLLKYRGGRWGRRESKHANQSGMRSVPDRGALLLLGTDHPQSKFHPE